jgi:tetratricopeptide (TPR) repeat protein
MLRPITGSRSTYFCQTGEVRLSQKCRSLASSIRSLPSSGLESGHTSDALKEARAALALDPIDPRTIGEAGYVLAAAGQTAEARKLLATLNDMVHRGSAYPVYAALIHMGLGQRNEALDAIEENGDAKIYGHLVQWHVFEELKTDPRYQKLVAKAGEIRTSRPSPDVSAQ